MRCDGGVGRDEPGMAGASLEHELTTSAPTSLEVDESSHLIRPNVLRDESMRGWEHILLGAIEQKDEITPERRG